MGVIMNDKIRRLLLEFNPFWKGGYQIEYKPRDIYPDIAARLPEKQILALCGLRRTGKTTLLKKIITQLLQEHQADSILYFSFDDFPAEEFFPVIDEFVILHGKKTRFLILDEIQKLPNWAEKIKILYDSGQYKIVVSGSASLFLVRGARESLAGRIFEFEIGGLGFAEYLRFKEQEALIEKPQLYPVELQSELERYLLSGGFPELVGKTDYAFIRDYIKSAVIDKIVYMDLVKIFPIEYPRLLSSILEILIDRPGMLVDYNSFARELGSTRKTISNYFSYLERAYLVKKLYNFSRNRSTSEKKLKKYYPTFLSPTLSHRIDEEHLAAIIETVCAIKSGATFFWRDKQQHEIDLILTAGEKILPVEVKYRLHPGQRTALSYFSKKFGCNQAIIITRNAKKEQTGPPKIQWIPVTEFLLLHIPFI